VSARLPISEPAAGPAGRPGLGTVNTSYGPSLPMVFLWMEMVSATDCSYALKEERRVVAVRIEQWPPVEFPASNGQVQPSENG
jgi:hypothetical protein